MSTMANSNFHRFTDALLATGLTALALAAAPSQAAIASSTTGNGELFMSVFDATAKVSYTFDTGVLMDDFFVFGQQDSGSQRFWQIDDANWTDFLSRVNVSNLRWAVMAGDSSGTQLAGGTRLFTTLSLTPAGTGPDYVTNGPTNTQFTSGLGSTQLGTFISGVNVTGTHGAPGAASIDYSVNGSSVNAQTDPGINYFGEPGGTGPDFNTNMRNLHLDNAVGQSSFFYYITRTNSPTGGIGNGILKATFDEFDNLGHDGYFGFTYVDALLYPTSPFAGKYLLSYTIASALPTAQQTAFAASIGRTEHDGGFSVVRLDGVAAAGFETGAGLTSVKLGGVGTAGDSITSSVPEPTSWALLLGGLGVLSARRAIARCRHR